MIEEAVELPASGIEGVLFRFCDARPDERAALLLDEVEEQRLYRLLAQVWIMVMPPDDFAAEHPDMVAVSA